MLEHECKAEIKNRLNPAGWMIVDTSQPTRAYQQMKDFPDLICFRAGHTIMLEVKGDGGKPSEGQWLFRQRIGPHLGAYLHHMFIYHPDQLPGWMTAPIN